MRDEITEDIMMRNQKLTLENELLRRERDEARRLYCEEWAFTIELERGEASDPRDLANEKKWDCYKGAEENAYDIMRLENELLLKERDDARLRLGRIFREIDCRIEHGAESNGHLEAIRNLFKETRNEQ